MTTLPTISPETLPSTPAKEWAAQTTASLSPDSKIRQASKFDGGNKEHAGLTTLTPGPDFPGAYPGDFDEPDAFTTVNAKNAAIGVLHTAKQYIPTQQDVEKAMLTASETAKHFLPNAVTSYFPAATRNKPDREIASTGPKVLPGENGESGVDERTDHRKRPLVGKGSKTQFAETSTAVPSISHIPNGGGDSTIPPPLSTAGSSKTELSSITKLSTQAQAGSDTTATPTSTTATSTPPVHSSESPHASLTADGVVNNDATSHTAQPTLPPDDLKSPDTAHEVVHPGKEASDLSKTDTQIAKQPVVNTTPRTYALTNQDAKQNGVSLTESAESSENDVSGGVNERDEKRTVKNDIQVPTAHHPIPLVQPTTPCDAAVHKQDGSISESSNTSGSGSSRNPSKSKIKGSSGSPSAGGPHKSRFMDKIKGEVKVLSGKLAHNEEKVEEGRRLMGKAA